MDQDAQALERGFALLLEEVASPHGSPAGGTTIAWSLALAASLAELCVGVTVRRGGEEAAAIGPRAAQARELRLRALDLGDRDREAYAAVLEAERAGDEAARVAALAGAADVLVELVATATDVAELAARLTVESVEVVAGDATAAALLAEAVARASAHLVAIDLAAHPDDPRGDHATQLADRATAARADALGGF
jgi:formiminotetrahydrofolate cyclodeaminase